MNKDRARARVLCRRKQRLQGVFLAALVATLGIIIFCRSGAGSGQQASSTETVPPSANQVTVKLENLATPTPAPIITPEDPPACQVTIPVYELPPEYKPARVARYVDIDVTPEEWAELEAVIFLEAGNQSAEGQQAVAEVVFNRVLHPGFPNTVHEVLHQGQGTDIPQFSVIDNLHLAEPNEEQYAAIYAALYGESIIPTDVVFFSKGGENDRVWGKIGDHVFCREYIWE